jgi:hypothetical protein
VDSAEVAMHVGEREAVPDTVSAPGEDGETMSDNQKQDENPQFHLENGLPVFDTRLSEIERKQDESEKRDARYRNEQLSIERRMVYCTVALVLATTVTGIIGGYQACTARISADAARLSSETSYAQLFMTKKQIDNSRGDVGNMLEQIRNQTTAQRQAARAADESAKLARTALHISERAYLMTRNPETNEDTGNATIAIPNTGKIPSGQMRATAYEATMGGEESIKAILEFHWFSHTFDAVPPTAESGTWPNLLITIPRFSKPDYDSGRQQIMVAGGINYSDGFSDDPIQTWNFCWVTVYQVREKRTLWTTCPNTLETISTLKKMATPDNMEK